MPDLAGTQVTEERLSSERNRILYGALTASCAATLLLAILLVLVQWKHAGWLRSSLWFGAASVVTAGRLLLGRSYARRPLDAENGVAFEKKYMIGSAAAG